ncbi:MAG: DUF4258 domain-containing protein [bacterium]|nr:DUF4258 domain-containing protein [bacterium]
MSVFAGLEKYEWTRHAQFKMRQYGLSEQRVKRVIRYPYRSEEGVLENAVAVMQPASLRRDKNGKQTWGQEIWVMYKLASGKRASSKFSAEGGSASGGQIPNSKHGKKIRVITAWRYPGVSPKRDPIPVEIMEEVRALL